MESPFTRTSSAVSFVKLTAPLGGRLGSTTNCTRPPDRFVTRASYVLSIGNQLIWCTPVELTDAIPVETFPSPISC